MNIVYSELKGALTTLKHVYLVKRNSYILAPKTFSRGMSQLLEELKLIKVEGLSNLPIERYSTVVIFGKEGKKQVKIRWMAMPNFLYYPRVRVFIQLDSLGN